MSLSEAALQALHMLLEGDPSLWGIIYVSLRVCFFAMLLAAPPAIMLAFLLANFSFPGRRILVVLIQTLQALPTVVIGLILYFLLTRNGPLGAYGLLFTQGGMILGEAVLAFPILAAMTLSALQSADPRVTETARTLGAGSIRAAWTLMMEVRFAIMAAIVTGFARVISEVGCAMMIGGNIAGVTRNITTAIALETSKGEFAQGIALGIVLVAVALVTNAGMALLQGKGGLK
ncbi:MAG: ABC transporter permease [Methylobacillus sp.]|jgi:tungstate transport system permease protein|nr:ABC transporter permease [Methylobacillus sp.]